MIGATTFLPTAALERRRRVGTFDCRRLSPAGAFGRSARKGEAGMLESNSWLWWIIIGGIAGAIAKFLMPGRDPGGCIVTILLGIAGAFVAGFIGQSLGLASTRNGAGFIGAIIGAIIILAVYRLIAGRRA
jgi:uncharacterized membrane protein YeaQ/YmgE (transglycosylase-associated protein family)